MKNLRLRVAEMEDYKGLAEWLVQISQRSERHFLHTWSGETAMGLEQQWLAYLEDGELCYILAMREGELVGAMGSEYDEELGRGWLHGPHALEENWESISDELYKRLLLELPEGIRQFTAYLNIENRRGRGFYTRQGFKEGDHLNYDFWLVPEEGAARSSAGVNLLKEKHKASFKELYEELFPKAYYSAELVIQMIGGSHQVLVTAEGELGVGFAAVSMEGNHDIGEVQFFGVREGYRQHGYGRRLLEAAIVWLAEETGVERVCLNVGEDLIHARLLYESVGFQLRFTGIGLEKVIDGGGVNTSQ